MLMYKLVKNVLDSINSIRRNNRVYKLPKLYYVTKRVLTKKKQYNKVYRILLSKINV